MAHAQLRGCIPTKVMVTVRMQSKKQKNLKKIGVNAGDATMDWGHCSKRVIGIKLTKSAGIYDYCHAYDNVDVYRVQQALYLR